MGLLYIHGSYNACVSSLVGYLGPLIAGLRELLDGRDLKSSIVKCVLVTRTFGHDPWGAVTKTSEKERSRWTFLKKRVI